jgi:hypothetical protein
MFSVDSYCLYTSATYDKSNKLKLHLWKKLWKKKIPFDSNKMYYGNDHHKYALAVNHILHYKIIWRNKNSVENTAILYYWVIHKFFT